MWLWLGEFCDLQRESGNLRSVIIDYRTLSKLSNLFLNYMSLLPFHLPFCLMNLYQSVWLIFVMANFFCNFGMFFTTPVVVAFVGNKAKGRISKRVFQENKVRQIFRKTNISYPLICLRTYQRVWNVRFSGNLMCFVFLECPFWDSPFGLITDALN